MKIQQWTVGILLFDQVDLTDVTGPAEVFYYEREHDCTIPLAVLLLYGLFFRITPTFGEQCSLAAFIEAR